MARPCGGALWPFRKFVPLVIALSLSLFLYICCMCVNFVSLLVVVGSLFLEPARGFAGVCFLDSRSCARVHRRRRLVFMLVVLHGLHGVGPGRA